METIKDAPIGRAFARLLQVTELYLIRNIHLQAGKPALFCVCLYRGANSLLMNCLEQEMHGADMTEDRTNEGRKNE